MRDSADYDEFYVATSRRVLGQIYAMTGSMAEAEDVVAEAYTRAWQRWNTVSDCQSPEAWVRTVASRIAISNWRKTRNRLLAHRRGDVVAPAQEIGSDHVDLVRALRGIPVQQRRAIVLHYLVGLTVAQIADEVDAAEGTVKSWLSRGRSALARQLGEPEQASPTRKAVSRGPS